VSKEAVQLAEQLKLAGTLREISALRQAQSTSKLSPEQSMHLLEIREDVREVIEQTRMEIDYTDAEFSREEAVYSELLQAYTDARDTRVDRINAYGFPDEWNIVGRWRGARHSDLCKPQVCHSLRSDRNRSWSRTKCLLSLRTAAGKGGKFERDPHPNMLSKVFGYQVPPEIDYPDSIWTWLNSTPPIGTDKSRLKFLLAIWQNDINIHHFSVNQRNNNWMS